MYHVIKILQDSRLLETTVPEAEGLAYFESSINDPMCLICAAWNDENFTWAYWHQVEATAGKLSENGDLIAAFVDGLDETAGDLPAPEKPAAPPAPVFVIAAVNGALVEGQIITSAVDPTLPAMIHWLRASDGQYFSVLDSDLIADDVPNFGDPRRIVATREAGARLLRRLESTAGDKITAYTLEGEITGRRVDVFAEFPAPDFTQILVANLVIVVLTAALDEPAAVIEPAAPIDPAPDQTADTENPSEKAVEPQKVVEAVRVPKKSNPAPKAKKPAVPKD